MCIGANQCEDVVPDGWVGIYTDETPAEEVQQYISAEALDNRPEFRVEVFSGLYQKMQLGLTISVEDDPSYVTIDDIWEPSLIGEWNGMVEWDKRVKVGDAITAANFVGGSANLILDTICSASHTSRINLLHLDICPKNCLPEWRARQLRLPQHTADLVLFHAEENTLRLLTITLKHGPFANCIALPGTFVENGETEDMAAMRELMEVHPVQGTQLVRVGVFDKPGRDPRGMVATTAFTAFSQDITCTVGSENSVARWLHVKDLAEKNWGFDHAEIVSVTLRFLVELSLAGVLKSILPKGTDEAALGDSLAEGLTAFSAREDVKRDAAKLSGSPASRMKSA
jgi:ADP-ribose pyrophosphatase YjhB (NUDIX family)